MTKIEVDDATPWQHEPGSPQAVRQGCTCSQARNNGGKGELQADGYHWFPSIDCPIHGLAAAKRAGVLKRPRKTRIVAETSRSRQRRPGR
jgi:hypothetical protein